MLHLKGLYRIQPVHHDHAVRHGIDKRVDINAHATLHFVPLVGDGIKIVHHLAQDSGLNGLNFHYQIGHGTPIMPVRHDDWRQRTHRVFIYLDIRQNLAILGIPGAGDHAELRLAVAVIINADKQHGNPHFHAGAVLGIYGGIEGPIAVLVIPSSDFLFAIANVIIAWLQIGQVLFGESLGQQVRDSLTASVARDARRINVLGTAGDNRVFRRDVHQVNPSFFHGAADFNVICRSHRHRLCHHRWMRIGHGLGKWALHRRNRRSSGSGHHPGIPIGCIGVEGGMGISCISSFGMTLSSSTPSSCRSRAIESSSRPV